MLDKGQFFWLSFQIQAEFTEAAKLISLSKLTKIPVAIRRLGHIALPDIFQKRTRQNWNVKNTRSNQRIYLMLVPLGTF